MIPEFSHFLVPYDASASSKVAMEGAQMLARSIEGSKLTFLFVHEHHPKHPPLHSEEEIRKEIAAHADQSGIDYDFVMREGKVYREIVKAAAELDVDLIIMGTHGTSGFQEFFAGSNSYRVATAAPCPVITVKDKLQLNSFHTLVLPIDNSRDTRQKVPQTAILAQLLNAEVHVLVITGHAEEEKNRLHMYGLQAQKFLEAGKVKTKFETMEGKSSYKLVTEYAKKVKADLIVIMTEQESESLFMGPTAQQMIHHSPYPVMSVKPHEVNISYAQL